VRISQNVARRIRRIALIAGGGAVTAALCMGSLGAGTAFADEDESASSGWTLTTPVDAFSDHWQEYHKGKDFSQEPSNAANDPDTYTKIHQEMFENMLPK
jgi:hypothetical protein